MLEGEKLPQVMRALDTTLQAFGLYLQGLGSLRVILNRVVALGGKWNIDKKMERGNIGWEIIGLIQLKDVEGLNRGSGSGNRFESN